MPSLCECDLSIIIPVYNLENFLTPMLTSLKGQVHDYKVEHIFVLNNCADRSEEVIRESGIDCTIIECTEQGCGPARNAGFEIARGKYIWFMDGDDWLLYKDAIQEAMDKVQGKDIIRVPFISDLYQDQYFSMVWQYVLRKDFVKEFRFPSIQPAEDDAYMREVLNKLRCYKHLSLPKTDRALYFYNYLREGSNMYRCMLGEKI